MPHALARLFFLLFCIDALLWRCSEGLGQPHTHVTLEVTSSGSLRPLVRREGVKADHEALLDVSHLGGLHANNTIFHAKPGTGADVTDKACDETKKMCCRPPLTRDPRGLYMMCLQRNCQKMNQPAPVCQAKGICTKACAAGCCCFWMGTFFRAKTFMVWVKQSLFKLAVMLLAFQEGFVQAAEKQPSSKVKESYDPAEAAAYAVDVLLDALKWGFGIPLFSLVAVSLQIRLRGVCRSLTRKKEKRAQKQRPEVERRASDEGEETTQFEESARKELYKFLDEAEQDRLGGVQKITMAKMSGISDFTWTMTQALGVGLYHLLMMDLAQTGFCVLGKSGRLLVLNRKPMLSAVSASRMFRGVGTTFILLVIIMNTYLRTVEHTLKQAQEAKDPAVRAKATKAEPLAQLIKGRVSYFTLAFALLLWLFFFFLMKFSIRPWGSTDERNFYESKEASVGQYFRTGSRGVLPCLSRRRRTGGLRIFFGPYPEKHVFDHLGTAWTLRNLEPCLMLPTETDNGYPQSGSGQPASSEEKAANAGLALGLLNSTLGTLGLVIFGIHIYNFLTNVQNCPIGNVVRDCVSTLDCTGVAKTPWFAHHLVSKGLRTTAELASDQLLPKVETQTLANWLNVSVNLTQQTVLNISREACDLRYTELFVDPNSTVYSATADTLGKMNAANYLYAVAKYGYMIKFDESAMHCKDCVRSVFLFYFTNFDNVIEIIEVLMLAVTTYVSALVYRLTTRKLTNCPMVDLSFASDPGSGTELDVDGLEKMCLEMVGHCFFFRYNYRGVPPHMAAVEQSLRKDKTETEQRSDPWCTSDCQSWNDYELTMPNNRRMMVVNRQLLGILEGEEIVSAWSATPLLTLGQKLLIFGGFLFCFVIPLYFAATKRSAVCAVEAFVMELLHWGFVTFLIYWRRPQAGFVLTSRRLFQVSRLPAYRDIFGKTEPMLKLDVLIHNCGVVYSSMTMEAYTPLWRRVLGKIMRMPVHRRGQMVVEGEEGIFKLWRSIGDTRDLFKAMSQVTYVTKLQELPPELGRGFMQEEEKVKQLDDLPDPTCACCCCPRSPPPVDMDAGPLLERYVERRDRELDVYSRKLCIRPTTCTELCCGRGCNLECTLCCCCRLDEMLTDFVVTTHRILVEQRTVQRYCRWFSCCRNTPNIRTTYLAHHRAAAYLCEKDAQAFGISKLRQDLNVKLLQQDAREYSAGLMLMQRPYAILTKQGAAKFKDKLWVSHIVAIYDIMTQRQATVEDPDEFDGSAEGDGSWHSEPGEELEAAEAPPSAAEELAGGKRGKACKGAGKSKIAGKGKGKAPSKGKGSPGQNDAGPPPGFAGPAAAVAAHTTATAAAASGGWGGAAASAAADGTNTVVDAAASVAATNEPGDGGVPANAAEWAGAAVTAARGLFGAFGGDGGGGGGDAQRSRSNSSGSFRG